MPTYAVVIQTNPEANHEWDDDHIVVALNRVADVAEEQGFKLIRFDEVPES